MMGLTSPITGKLNATAHVMGRFPNESLNANAAIQNGTVGRIQLQRAEVAVSASRGHGSLQRAIVQIPYLTATGSGTFGLHARDPLDLALHATSPDIGKLMATANGKTKDISGALDTTLHVTGTRLDPMLNDTLALDSLRYGKITIPRISGTIIGTRTQVAIENGLVQLKRGNVAVSGRVPIAMKPRFEIDPGNKPVRFALTANNVDFSNFEAALPQGTHLAGTFGGAMTVTGTIDDPKLNGTLALHNGYFVGPIDQNPIQKLTGQLAFNGTTLAVYNLHADVGGGTMDLNGKASVPDVRDIRDATFHSTLVAKGAQFNSPQYFRGKVDANITASRATARTRPMIAGTVNLPNARIPLSAFWNPRAPQGPPRKLPDIGLDIAANVGNDVRVQSSNVDVGAQGAVKVGGSLNNPQLSGQIASTGGTVDFFRRFSIESANIRFDPSNGIMPFINATATTQVPDPLTYIALNVSGLAPNNMKIAFSSDPSYDRAQIMGLLAGVNELNKLGQGGGDGGGFSVASTVQNMATGELNTFFTRQLLEPLSASLGNAMGLQNLQLTDDFHSGFGIAAAKAFGKHLTFLYRQSLGTPRRQQLSFQAHRHESTAFDLTFYQVDSPALLSFQQNASSMFGFLDASSLMNPTLGTSGFTFSYQHRFQ
jgi:translocation and assembly module TamB